MTRGSGRGRGPWPRGEGVPPSSFDFILWAPGALMPLLGVVVLLMSLPPLVPAPPALATDVFITNCTQLPDPPLTGFLKWSNLSTWTSSAAKTSIPGAIPGVGAGAGANVTIPCGTAVLLDSAAPTLNLTVLLIQGFLKVEDPPTTTTYNVAACLVLVEGQLTIGAASAHFRSKITFTLMPNPIGRQNWAGTSVWPAEPAYPRNVGHKPFAVMGGQVHFHGMPGGGGTPSWVKLNVSAKVGDFRIVVDQDVSATWPVLSRIAIASTDVVANAAEEFTITGYDTHPRGTLIYLDRAMVNNHYGEPYGIPDGFGGYIDERAEVGLLSRNIVITGLDETGPYKYEGGHFIIYMTPVPQYIEGVEYFLMGQQGNLGRYNIHFHVCGDTRGLSVVRKNAIHNSKQRCVVVHGTHNLTVDSNVAYNTSGHCFMIEEGGEQNNTFINNLGFLQRAVDILIASDETDNSPSTFWITNMNNNYIGNVAGGSDNSGFWTELKNNVRGMSLSIPKLAGIIPRYTAFGRIDGNVAHSSGVAWRFYPSGVDPRLYWDVNQTQLPTWQWPQIRGYVYNLQVHKQQGDGVFMHNSNNVFLVNLTAADNNWGIEFNTNYGGGVLGGRFLALSNNLGTANPGWCTGNDPNVPLTCAPVKGCTLNKSDPTSWRYRGWNNWLNPMFGITVDSPGTWTDGRAAYTFANLTFSGYDPPICGRVSAAFGTGISGNSRWWWSAATNVQGVKTAGGGVTSFWFANSSWTWPVTTSAPVPLQAYDTFSNYAVWDRDGSIVGGTGGFLIANTPDLAPPAARYSCTPWPQYNALACPGTCYRSIQISFREDLFTPFPFPNSVMQPNRTRGDYSYVVIRRVEDNVTHILDGNANDTGNAQFRSFWASLLAPATYELSIRVPTKNPSFWPANLTIQYTDNGGCKAPVTLRVMSLPKSQWAIATSDQQFWAPCPGTSFTGNSTPWTVQYQFVCHKNRQVLQLTLLGAMDPTTSVFLVATNLRVLPCRLPFRCGVFSSSDWYYYNISGKELRPPAPGSMGYFVPGYPQASWGYGQALFGNVGWSWGTIRTVTTLLNNTLQTHYFRKTFTVTRSACYAGIFLDFVPNNGLLVFLNTIEIFRWNLPQGNITNATQASSGMPWPDPLFNSAFINITSTNASFVEGTNYLAYEIHGSSFYNTGSYFDSRVSLLSNSVNCQGASVMPEVCDGVDNNFDGLVDVDPVTGKVFTRPCATACGTGIETCIGGAFVNCTAPPALPETCNGVDDNCDGLTDNGATNTQLNCAAGSVCFKGQCLPQGNLTAPKQVFNRSLGGWYYLDKGWPWQTFPNWINARFANNPNDTTIRLFKAGTAPFTTNYPSGSGAPVANTTLTTNINGDIYYYFLRPFNLTADEAASTWSLSVNVMKDQGAIVWANGVEIMRSNFPATWTPSTDEFTYPSSCCNCWNNCWYPNTALRSTGFSAGAVKAGTNWIAAQVANTQWQGNTLFDLELIRNVQQNCSSLPGSPASCVLNPTNDTYFLPFGSTWKYLDLNYSLPGYTWHLPGYNDSAWPSGRSPLGLPSWYINTYGTAINMSRPARITYYFRTKVTLGADASCYYSFLFQLKALDAAVVYVNGFEVYRFQMDGVPWIFPTSYSLMWPPTDKANFTLSTGWLVPGPNTLAVEVHLSSQNTGSWYFDFALSGQRDGLNCAPLAS